MAKNNNLQDFLTDLANAIREKKGTSDLINPQDFSAEIESIQTGGDISEIVVDVPNGLQFSGTSIAYYTFDLGNGEYLVSSSSGNGVWKLDVKNNSWIQLFANNSYNFFIQIDDRVIIARSTGSAEILVYDTLNKNIYNLTDNNGNNVSYQINNAYDTGNSVLFTYTDAGHAIYVYDKITKKIIKNQRTSNITNAPSYTYNNKTLITTRGSSSCELWIYNDTDNTISVVSGTESLTRSLVFSAGKNNIVTFISNYSNLLGFYFLNLETEVLTHATHDKVDTMQISQTYILDNGVIILGKQYTKGVYAYDTNTLTYIAENTDSALPPYKRNMFELDNIFLYCSDTSSITGLWQFDKRTNVFTKVTNLTAYNYILLTKLIQEDMAIIARTGNDYLYVYKNQSLTNIYGYGSSSTYSVVEVVEDYVKFNNKERFAQLKYDIASNAVKSIGVIL